MIKKHFVAVAGNVGVGKSTLTTMLSEKCGWEPFYEAVGDNPYLADFYKDLGFWPTHNDADHRPSDQECMVSHRHLEALRKGLDRVHTFPGRAAGLCPGAEFAHP